MTAFDAIARARPYIEAALEHGSALGAPAHTFDDIARGILSGVFTLWPLPSGCMVTEFVQYPRKRVLHVFLGGGDLGEIIDMHDMFDAFARQNGCSEMTVTGRAGWSRVLVNHGWKREHVTMARAIPKEG